LQAIVGGVGLILYKERLGLSDTQVQYILTLLVTLVVGSSVRELGPKAEGGKNPPADPPTPPPPSGGALGPPFGRR